MAAFNVLAIPADQKVMSSSPLPNAASVIIPKAHARVAQFVKELPDVIPAAEPLESTSSILITGANGLLGLHLIAKLAESMPQAQVFALVRAKTDSDARKRLIVAAKEANLQLPPFLYVVAGDVSNAKLGLTEKQWNDLAGRLDAIIHCAASVNWGSSFDDLVPTNIGGVEEVIKLAIHRRPKRLLAVSTCGAAPVCYGERASVRTGVGDNLIDVNLGIPEETDVLDPHWIHDKTNIDEAVPVLAYRLSKWAGEKLVLVARSHGLVASVIRPPILFAGPTGAVNGKDLPARVLHAIISTGSIPEGADQANWGSVSLCVAAVIANLDCAKPIVHQPAQGMRLREIASWLQSFGYGPIHTMPYEQWAEQARGSRLGALMKLGLFQSDWFDTRALVAEAPEPKASDHPLNEHLMHQALRFLVQSESIPRPGIWRSKL